MIYKEQLNRAQLLLQGRHKKIKEGEDVALETGDVVLEAQDAALESKDVALEAEDVALEAEDVALEAKDIALESECQCPNKSNLKSRYVHCAIHRPRKQVQKFSKFLTCTYPRKLQAKKELNGSKYEIVVLYTDTGNNQRRKNIRFGSHGVADIRDKGSMSIDIKKRVIKKNRKGGKFIIKGSNSGQTNTQILTEEQWPLNKEFWAMNFLWNPSDENMTIGEECKSVDLESIVQVLQNF